MAATVAALGLLGLAGCGTDQGSGPTAAGPSRTASPSAGGATSSASPFPAPSPPASQPPARPVTLAFGGDIHFEGVLRDKLAADPTAVLDPIAPVLSAADLAVVNLETAVTERGDPAGKEYVFRAPPTALTALSAAGVDVASMANNHGMDFGLTGLRDSLAAGRAAGFPLIGIGNDAGEAFRPYVARLRGQLISVIGATQVMDSSLRDAWTAGDGKPGLASAYDEDRLLAAVRAARRASDTVVVYLHWGRELVNCPIDRQRALAPKLVQAGADVVVGSHAHVLLGGGRLGRAYIHYGLGNFVFYSSGNGPKTRSGVLTVTVQGRDILRSTWTPARLQGGVATPLPPAEAPAAVAAWAELRGCTGLSAG